MLCHAVLILLISWSPYALPAGKKVERYINLFFNNSKFERRLPRLLIVSNVTLTSKSSVTKYRLKTMRSRTEFRISKAVSPETRLSSLSINSLAKLIFDRYLSAWERPILFLKNNYYKKYNFSWWNRILWFKYIYNKYRKILFNSYTKCKHSRYIY